jgi:PAS domain S-box-containing protein
MEERSNVLSRHKALALGLLVLFGLYLTSLYNYLLFHGLAELFAIVVACSIFVLSWNARRFIENNYFLLIGIAYLFVSGIDVLHILAYKGMSVFHGKGNETNLSAQLWIAGRYLESFSLLIAPLFVGRRLNTGFVFVGYTAMVAFLVGSIFAGVFPECFIEGKGLTTFKKTSEYVISFILVAAVFLLLRKQKEFDRSVLRLLIASIVMTMTSELAFTFYIHAYGFSNLVGHFLKIISYYLIYKAIIETGLIKPYNLLFRNLKQREKALRNERDFAESLLNTAQVIVLVLDNRGRIIYFNPYMEEVSGYRLDDMRGSDWLDVFLPQQYQTDGRELFLKAISGVQIRGGVIPLVTKDGQRREIEWNNKPLQDVEGNTIGLLCVGQDITERKHAEETLRNTLKEAQQRRAETLALLESSRAVLEYHDFRDAAYSIFQSCKKLTGATAGYVALMNENDAKVEILFLDSGGLPCSVDPSLPIPIRGLRAEVYHAGKVIYHNDFASSEWAKFLPKGHVELENVLFAPLVIKGKVAGLLGIANKPGGFTENDARMASAFAELAAIALHNSWTLESLESSEERFRSVAQSANDAIISADSQGNIIFWNQGAENIFGYSTEEAVGKSLTFIMPERFRESHQKGIDKMVLTGESKVIGKSVELVGLRKDGNEFPLELSLASWKTKEGVFFTGIVRDITERRQAEEELVKHREQLEQLVDERTAELMSAVELLHEEITERKRVEEELLRAQKLESLGILAGGIAHDFNNVLTAILNNIYIAKMLVGPESEVFKRLGRAEKAALRAQTLTRQLLTFSRGGTPVKRAASIKELIEETTDFALRGSNVKCEYSFSEDLWPVEIDEGQISQVISNLVINAQQAMPDGGVIKMYAGNVIVNDGDVPSLRRGRYIKLSIKDTGVGIPEKHLPKIFDPFFTTKREGSGLGLATTYSIIKKHDGHITVESEVGSGTTFDIYLPASQRRLLTGRLEKGKPFKNDIRKTRILVMDDEPDIRESLSAALNFFGYEVDFAGDGAEAIDLYRKAKNSNHPFDAVVMDLTIPGGMGGVEAIKKLIQIDPNVKAIASSGYANDPIMSEFKNFGFKGVITKPYRVEELGRLLHEIITQ